MYSAAPFKDQLPNEFVIYDLETTGLDVNTLEITEIGALLVRDGVIVDRAMALVKTKNPIPDEVVKITGITNEMLAEHGADLPDVLAKFIEFIDGRPLVGHNIIGYDNPILTRVARETLGIELNITKCVDTAGLYKAKLLDRGIRSDGETLQDYCKRVLDERITGIKYSLSSAHDKLGCPHDGIIAHRVAGDIQMVFDIYKVLTSVDVV